MFEDLRDAVRSVTRAKRLLLMLLVSLALATGANVAVGRAVYALLFEAPAGVSAPGDLVSIYTSQSGGALYGPSSYNDYDAVRSGAPAIALIAAVDDRSFANAGVEGQTARARIAAVSATYFSMLGLRPHIGRLLDAGDRMRRPRPVVIGFSRWQAMGGHEQVLGRSMLIGPDEHVIVGVVPRDFRGLRAGRAADLWVPLTPPDEGGRNHRILSLFGRLSSGAHIEDAARETRAIASRVAATAQMSSLAEGRRDQSGLVTVVPYTRLDPERRRQTVRVAAVVVGTMILLLVSGCANAANLLVSRAASRRGEAAVKLALGASRARLVRQALAESLLVALSSAIVSLPVAAATTSVVPLLFSSGHAELVDTGFDLPLVAGVLLASIACGLAFGLTLALGVMRTPAGPSVRGDAGGISPHGLRVRTALVSAQVALSLLLLVVTGLMRRSVSEGLTGDLGFSARRVAMIAVDGPGSPLDPQRSVDFQQTAERVLLGRPGLRNSGWSRPEIRGAAWAATPPLGTGNSRSFSIEADAVGTVESVELDINVVSFNYFRTMQMTLLEGRLFDVDDRERGSPVVVVDERLASRYFGGHITGRFLRDAAGKRYAIVGMVKSGSYRTLQESPAPTVYVPHTQEFAQRSYFFVRTTGDPAPLLPILVSDLQAIDSGARIVRTTTLQDHFSQTLVLDRMTLWLMAVAGLIALAQASIGVYGVVSDAVERRTREIGLRMALGADSRRLAALVFLEALRPTAAGVGLGLVALFFADRVARSFVYEIPAADVPTMAGAAATLLTLAILAAAPPLRRALRVSPTVALRHQG